MDPVRLEDENGNLLSSTTVVTGKRKLPDLSTVMQLAKEAEDSRGPYGQALPGMTVTPDTEVRKQITLNDIKNAVVDNPAKTALAVGGTGAAILGAPLTIPAAAVLGMAAEGADKFRPFSDRESDYKTMTPAENMVDIGSAGVFSVLGDATLHGIGSGARQFNRMADDALARVARVGSIERKLIPERPTALGDVVSVGNKNLRYEVSNPRINGLPTIPATEIGGLPGYQIADYELIPGANEIEKQLKSEGIPRFVLSSNLDEKGAELLPLTMVGNPRYMMDARTPEGKLFTEGIARRDPWLDYNVDQLHSGSRSTFTFDPEQLTARYTTKSPTNYNFEANGKYHPSHWNSVNDVGLANTYAYQFDNPVEGAQYLKYMFDKGMINDRNLPLGFQDVASFKKYVDNVQDVFSDRHTSYLLRKSKANTPIVVETIPFHPNVKVYDKEGGHWYDFDKVDATDQALVDKFNNEGARKYQEAQLQKAWDEGYQAVVYKNTQDRGGAYRTGMELPKSNIGDVLVGLDPRLEKYPFNYGLWNLKDGRPLAAVPFAALGALGATAAKDRQ